MQMLLLSINECVSDRTYDGISAFRYDNISFTHLYSFKCQAMRS